MDSCFSFSISQYSEFESMFKRALQYLDDEGKSAVLYLEGKDFIEEYEGGKDIEWNGVEEIQMMIRGPSIPPNVFATIKWENDCDNLRVEFLRN